MPTMFIRQSYRLSYWFAVAVLVLSVSSFGDVNAAESVAGSDRVQSLDGPWQVALDPNDAGKTEGWFKPDTFPSDRSCKVEVPCNIYEVDKSFSLSFWDSAYDVLKDLSSGRSVWYSREFTPSVPTSPDLRQYLRFGDVTHACEVWLNGTLIGQHEGGQAPFELDVTDAIRSNQPNRLTLRIWGQSVVAVTGINHHVTLVSQPTVRIKDVFAKPDIHAGRFELEITLENRGDKPAAVGLKAAWGQFKPQKDLGTVADKVVVSPGATVAKLTIPLAQPHLWDLDDPFLYTIRVTSDWAGAASPDSAQDTYSFRTGLRDFRMADGWFYLNDKRIYPKSAHGGPFDPIWIYASPRSIQRDYMKNEFAIMRRGGFNMFRFIVSAALPEQLDIADELGFLIYSEHETSWLQNEKTKFGIVLNDLVRRDRNHPSLVIWCLLNETEPGRFYDAAKAWLPSLRAIDDTRLVLLSSGRWDKDLKTGSASNPGSAEWDVYLGGEDPVNPIKCDQLVESLGGGYRSGAGDAHVYQGYPTTWKFIMDFDELGRNSKPVFLSEAGLGSSYNALQVERKMTEAGAPDKAVAWSWVRKGADGIRQTWPKYHMETLYPTPEEMLIDSELNAARQRELMFNIIRSNPRISGYNLTSLLDCIGNAEGVMDVFREYKAGHLPVLQAGWAKLRWCLFVNPMHVYSDRPMRVKVALASEDALPAGVYPATLSIAGPQGVVWKKALSVTVPAGPTPPLAYTVFDEDVVLPKLKAGTWKLSASFDNRENAASSELAFFVSEKSALPKNLGPITVLGVDQPIRDFLTAHGAVLREYAPDQATDREVIVVGTKLPGDTDAATAAAWRSLYGRIARGAHGIFLWQNVFSKDKDRNHWLALAEKGEQTGSGDWLYHKDIVAKPHAMMAGLQTKIMTPDYYADVLSGTDFFYKVTPPDDAVAVAIRASFAPFDYKDGVMLGVYNHHAGKFTINGLNLPRNIGHPAADRLLLNMVEHAKATAAPIQSLLAGYDAELDSLGIRE